MAPSAPAPPTRRTYRAFGLTIGADLDLPELAPADGGGAGEIDVEIARGAVGAAPAQAHGAEGALQVTPEDVWLACAAGRFRASRGRTIAYAPAPGAPAGEIRLYILGSLLGAVLHQRGVLALHANAVVLDDHAIAMAGPSGAGKSTLAAAFLRRGRAVLSDDVCAVGFDASGQAVALPGPARIKLWGETLAAFGRSAEGLERLAAGFDKFSLSAGEAVPAAAPLRRLYILDPDGAASIRATRLTGAAAVNAILSHVYRWPMAAAMGRTAGHFAQAAALARSCEVRRLAFPRDLTQLQALTDCLDADRFEPLPSGGKTS